MKEYFLPKTKIHKRWDPNLTPALEIEPGDLVHFDAEEGSCGQITPESTSSVLSNPGLDFQNMYPLAGPVFVKGLKKGNVLSIEIVETRVGSWGWTAIIPGGFGLLPEDFQEPYLKIWDLSNGKTAKMNENIQIPLDPFCGTMGVCPAGENPPPIPIPGQFGGNLDHKHLHAGSTLLLPAQIEGGLFSAGDCHAAQGDGEVCVSAIESPMIFALRFGIRRDISIQEPQFICRGTLTPQTDRKGYFGTMGIGPDIKENAQKAIRYMVEHLVSQRGMTREEAYVLCSLTVDLKINAIVNAPNVVVSAYLPLSIFDSPD